MRIAIVRSIKAWAISWDVISNNVWNIGCMDCWTEKTWMCRVNAIIIIIIICNAITRYTQIYDITSIS